MTERRWSSTCGGRPVRLVYPPPSSSSWLRPSATSRGAEAPLRAALAAPCEVRTDLGTVAFAAGYIDVAESLGQPGLARAVAPVLEAAARGLRYCLTNTSPVCQLLATAHRLDGDVAIEFTPDEVERDLEGAPSRLVAARVAYDRAVLAAMQGDGGSAGALAAEAGARFDDLGAALLGLARSDALRRRVTGGSVAPPRRTRVILVTDLVASTDLNVVVGDDRFVELLGEHDRAVRDLLTRHGGVAFKHTGDGFAAWFDRGDAANRCALAIQPVLDDLSLGHPSEQLKVRCGLAAGEPLDQDGDLFGLAVVRAARVCARAGAGEVLVADEVLALSSTVVYEPHGLTHLKGLPDSVMIHRDQGMTRRGARVSSPSATPRGRQSLGSSTALECDAWDAVPPGEGAGAVGAGVVLQRRPRPPRTGAR